MSVARNLCLPGYVALKHPFMAGLALLVAVIISTVSLLNLSFENDISKSFSSDSSYSDDLKDLIGSIGFVPRQIIVLAEGPDRFDSSDFATLRDLGFEFELIDHVSSVVSAGAVQFPQNHPLYPDAPLLPFELDIGEIEKRIEAIEGQGLRSTISADRKSALFVIALAAGLEADQFQTTLSTLREAAASVGGTRLTYTFTGEALIGPELVRALKRDLIVNNVIGCSLAFLLGVFLFGNFRLIIIAVLPALLAAFISLALFPILGYPITVLNTVIPILVLVLALADSVHLTLHFRDEQPDLPIVERAEHAIRIVGPACALTALTTAIAFAAIGLSNNQQLKELAAVGTVSVLCAYLIVIICFPILASRLGQEGHAARGADKLNLPVELGRWVLTLQKPIIGATALIVCVALIGLLQLKPWFNLDENLPTNSEVRIANQKISAEFGGIYRIWSSLDTTGPNRLETETGWRRLGQLTDALQDAAPDYLVLSLASLARWQGHPDRMLSEEELAALPQALRLQLLSSDRAIARVITVAPEAMFSTESLQVQVQIEESARLAGADQTIGVPVIMRHESVSVIQQLSVGLAFACLISVVMVAAYYRWPWLAPALIVPNALPLAVAAGSLAVTQNGELTPTAMLALTVAFGVAIDDSIHLVNRFKAELAGDGTVDAALNASIQKTGKAMLVTTILICTGMIVTMFSSFETIRVFGAMLILTFITAFLADILLLPILLRAMARKQ